MTEKKIQYWSGLPDYVFNKDCMIQNWLDANMLRVASLTAIKLQL